MIKRSRQVRRKLQVGVAQLWYVPFCALEPCLLELPHVSLTRLAACESEPSRQVKSTYLLQR